jgi:anti-sigma factor RsiW
MDEHVSEDHMTAWILGAGDEGVSRHLAACGACRAAADRLRAGIAAFATGARTAADRDAPFWNRQRIAIRNRLPESRRTPLLRWAAAAALALVLAATLLPRWAPQSRQQAHQDVADEVLLQQIQNDVEQDVPAALAPAVLISQERSAAESASVPADLGRAQEQEQQR